jgi:hypothetical protein
MSPLWIAIIFVAVVSALCIAVDMRSRRRRRGIGRLDGGLSREDRVAQVERIDPGTVLRADSTNWQTGQF